MISKHVFHIHVTTLVTMNDNDGDSGRNGRSRLIINDSDVLTIDVRLEILEPVVFL